jgi:hypothetical protein
MAQAASARRNGVSVASARPRHRSALASASRNQPWAARENALKQRATTL